MTRTTPPIVADRTIRNLRRVHHAIAIALAVLLTSGVNASAQSFSVTDFRDTAGFAYVNIPSAGTTSFLELTAGGALRPTVGAIWRRERVAIGGSWTSTVTFQIADTGGAADPSGRSGADGLALVIQLESPEAIGASGYGLAYHGIKGGLAVEVDTWDDSAEPVWNGATEDAADHVAIQSSGREPLSAVPIYSTLISLSRVIADVSDGAVHTLAVRYTPGLLRVYVDDCLTPALAASVWLDAALAPTAYIGITAATQSAWQHHRVLSWCFTATGVGCGCPAPCEVDTIRVPVPYPVHDTTIVYRDTGSIVHHIDTMWIRTHDSIPYPVFIPVHDTTRIEISVHDTTVVERIVIDSIPFPVYDTTRTVEYRDTCIGDTSPPRASLDTICGGQARLMERSLYHSQIDKVYPNPADGTVSIDFQVGDAGVWVIAIYDTRPALRLIATELHFEPGSFRLTVETDRLPPGLYLVALRRGQREVYSVPLEIRR